MSKHTPGPWENAKPVYPWQGPIVVVDDDVPICYVDDNTHKGGPSDDATALANARLIAAAPDMLAELKVARDLVVKWTAYQGNATALHDQYVAPIDDAIAKATGDDA